MSCRVPFDPNSRSVRLLQLAACFLLVKVTISVLSNYPQYFPADFSAEFLEGRQSYFYADYQWAFYPHLITGPISLILVPVLLSTRFLKTYPRWHRRLGQLQVFVILFGVVPSGFWMALYSAGGPVAKAGFVGLAIGTAACSMMGWRTAVQRRFREHRRWMERTAVLLCSAIVIRILGGFFTVTKLGGNETYPISAWVSWLVPLVCLELLRPHFRSNEGLKKQRTPVA